MFNINISRFLLTLLLSALIMGCKSNKHEEELRPAQELYNNGIVRFKAEQYQAAAKEFEKVFFQHPGNELTAFAELMQAYSLYRAGEYEEAIIVLDMFIKLHPRHQDIAYAYYLKSIAYYVQISEVNLDQSHTQQALHALDEVKTRFPSSKYALDVALKIDLAKDHLAGYEMLVGRYYLNKKNPIAAIRRFQAVIEHYNATSHVPEALYRLIESNLMLGLKHEAQRYHETLKYNYPQSDWYKLSSHLL